MADRPRPRLAYAAPAAPVDIPASARSEASIETDTLTGLATRAGLIDRLGTLLSNGARSAPPGLIKLDIDRFDRLNDGLGPAICDTLIRRAALRLKAVVPETAMLGRTSGSGFAVVLTDGGTAATVAARVREIVSRPYAISGHAVTVDASVGVAVAHPGDRDPRHLVHAVSLALHQAQRDGHGCIRSFEPAMAECAAQLHALESDFRAAITLERVELRRALSNDQFQLRYQPQIALDDGRLTGFEALLRWNHPVRGMVTPDQFVPLAEETGLIVLLGEWVIRAACRAAAAWPVPRDGIPLRVAVNVSPLQLREGGMLLATIDRALAETGLAPDRLEIELTETALADDIGATLSAIRARGCPLALDDFGTGHSSLSRLQGYPFTRLKIDRAFIANLETAGGHHPGSSALIVQAIAALGVGLGLQVTVEGVENDYQLDVARRAGCHEIQGFLVSTPLRADDVDDFIRRIDLTTDGKGPSDER